MSGDGTIFKTTAIVGSLIRGAIHDRRSIAKDFGVTVATADRYIRHLEDRVPGIISLKYGRRRAIRFNFGLAMREAGL